ncbi:uncharacterized protein LOC131669962 [Phymastichus coffea]|uniref:uncharacterized protein LOC131669962 n=1 Tax=Phymastichus coffea TaxID=108790 RepID=UPI00273AB95D|nr:uncharacterized protein LOC131669962 [Phymastichus coffea]XP_058801181.1 uncharacterized protein LOC131669962 [Phymastichus coffea]
MNKESHKCLINFYSKLESTDTKWKEIQASTNNVLKVLKHRIEQLRHVRSSEVDNAELCKVEELRERLVAKILAGIEDEVALVHEAIAKLNNYSQDLKQRLANLETTLNGSSLSDERMKELVEGTGRRPRLDLLIEWAIDACDFYHNLYLSLKASLKDLDYSDEGCVDKLSASLVEPQLAREKIDYILTLTQFLASETP